ncbi:hypothetical protein BDZ88DRAFT_436866 [Geranomyces variabilis]|nr:hypothetical protein BDZ88DRAFT_436866 [Geranomyces variabilis]
MHDRKENNNAGGGARRHIVTGEFKVIKGNGARGEKGSVEKKRLFEPPLLEGASNLWQKVVVFYKRLRRPATTPLDANNLPLPDGRTRPPPTYIPDPKVLFMTARFAPPSMGTLTGPFISLFIIAVPSVGHRFQAKESRPPIVVLQVTTAQLWAQKTPQLAVECQLCQEKRVGSQLLLKGPKTFASSSSALRVIVRSQFFICHWARTPEGIP